MEYLEWLKKLCNPGSSKPIAHHPWRVRWESADYDCATNGKVLVAIATKETSVEQADEKITTLLTGMFSPKDGGITVSFQALKAWAGTAYFSGPILHPRTGKPLECPECFEPIIDTPPERAALLFGQLVDITMLSQYLHLLSSHSANVHIGGKSAANKECTIIHIVCLNWRVIIAPIIMPFLGMDSFMTAHPGIAIGDPFPSQQDADLHSSQVPSQGT